MTGFVWVSVLATIGWVIWVVVSCSKHGMRAGGKAGLMGVISTFVSFVLRGGGDCGPPVVTAGGQRSQGGAFGGLPSESSSRPGARIVFALVAACWLLGLSFGCRPDVPGSGGNEAPSGSSARSGDVPGYEALLRIEAPPGSGLQSVRRFSDWERLLKSDLRKEGVDIDAAGFWTYPAYEFERDELLSDLRAGAESCPSDWLERYRDVAARYEESVAVFVDMARVHHPYSGVYLDQKMAVEDRYWELISVVGRCLITPVLLREWPR